MMCIRASERNNAGLLGIKQDYVAFQIKLTLKETDTMLILFLEFIYICFVRTVTFKENVHPKTNLYAVQNVDDFPDSLVALRHC